VDRIFDRSRDRVKLTRCASVAPLFSLRLNDCRHVSSLPDEYGVSPATAEAASLLAADAGAWQRSRAVVWGPEKYATTFRAVWSNAGLFVRFDATDPDPWHTLADHDAKLWDEEVVEVFLMPDLKAAEYAEVEISPANVSCDVWVNAKKRRFDLSWNLEGLETRVILRRAADQVTGWTAIAFLPWRGLVSAGQRPPPHAGERWRFNVFRIERPGGVEDPKRDALYLAWSPTGKPTFHVPEAFRSMVFLRDPETAR
jgi:hypothetical protein